MGKPKKKRHKFRDMLGPSSKGASGKSYPDTLKENPYKSFTLKDSPDLWFGRVQTTVVDFALFILDGYLWQKENSDTFYAVQSNVGELERVRDRLAVCVRRREDAEHWWPAQDEEEQLALIDFVRVLPTLWD